MNNGWSAVELPRRVKGGGYQDTIYATTSTRTTSHRKHIPPLLEESSTGGGGVAVMTRTPLYPKSKPKLKGDRYDAFSLHEYLKKKSWRGGAQTGRHTKPQKKKRQRPFVRSR